MNQTLRILVEGRVQGVFYRASAQREAYRLGINGYARNLPDGRVEIFAQGQNAALQTFIAWCRQGPSQAHVTDVTATPHDTADVFQDFDTY
ncbi:MAG: acylphosphatase [Gammaproteobacteria bacterium]